MGIYTRYELKDIRYGFLLDGNVGILPYAILVQQHLHNHYDK